MLWHRMRVLIFKTIFHWSNVRANVRWSNEFRLVFRLFPQSGHKKELGPLWVLVSQASPVHTAVRNCTRDEGGPFEVGNQVLISSHRKLLSLKATVVNVAEKSEQDSGRHG